MDEKWKGAKAAFLGDSITEGHGVSEESEIFLNLVKNKMGLSEAKNYGVWGTRFASQEDDNGLSYSVRFGKMDDNFDLIVVFGGTNDYGHGTAPIGDFNDRTDKTFYGSCHVLMSGLIEKYDGKTVVIMTPLHRENETTPNGATGEPLSKYVDIIKEVAEYYSIPVLDLWSLGGIQPAVRSNKERYCPDGLHPNAEGHKLIARRLIGFLNTI